MKNLVLIALVLIAFGCSKPKTPYSGNGPQPGEIQRFDGPILPVTTTQTRNAPSWIDNADREGKYTSVGIAEKTPLGNRAFQREIAINRGLAILAKKLNSDMDQLYMENNALNANAEGGKKAPEQETKQINNTIRNLVSARIKGATVPYYWVDSQDGTLYVLVHLNDLTGDALKHAALSQTSLREAVAELERTKREQAK